MKHLKLYEELYTNPYNPDEIWDTTEVIIDDMDKEEVYDYINSLIGKTIEFYQNGYMNDKKVGPVKLTGWEMDMPEGADFPGYDFFINGKTGYLDNDRTRGVDYFDVDTSKVIKIIK